ncbi:MAG: ATP-binding protein [Thermodesulfobacteriota bacterium]
MKRSLETYIQDDLPRKIILLTGPRQSGKTTLSKMLTDNFDYLNFDNPEHRLGLAERSWDRAKNLIIFDELHKLKNWKSWLKGIYDTEGIPPSIIVTGSARLDTYKKVGDSLAGRFFQFRLHPLDMKEVKQTTHSLTSQEALQRFLDLGGFPEPFLKGDKRFYKRWKRSHLGIILKQDLIDLENVQDITSIETLIQLLRKRVGSPISYRSLAGDLQCSDKTIKRWLAILENMYVIFRVPPFHRNISRAILKAPKYYFYDNGQVLGDAGVKLENLTACALLKEIHRQEDCYGEQLSLYYLKRKDGREVDFLITKEERPTMMIEVKWSDNKPSRNFAVFAKQLDDVKKVQIVSKINREATYPDGTEIRSAAEWLANLSLA